jgi:hypothetical protein
MEVTSNKGGQTSETKSRSTKSIPLDSFLFDPSVTLKQHN